MADDKSFFQTFWTDLTNVKLIKAKFIWFTTLFSLVVIYPFLSLHMTSLGLSERDVGIASSLSAVLNIISPFMWGFIGDKIGNFKILVSGLTFLSGVTVLLFTLIPSSTSSSDLIDISVTENTTFSNITITNSTTNGTLSHQTNDNYGMTFWSYFIVRSIYGLVVGGAYILYEGAIMSYMQEQNLDYGMQRVWGTLAVGISPSLGGLLKDYYGMNVVFYVSSAFYFMTAGALLFFDIEFKKSSKNLFKEIYSQITNPEIVMLMLIMIVKGALSGYIGTYFYIYLFGMGANNTLIGLTISAGVPFEMIIQICATVIIHRIGYVNTLVFGIYIYSLRAVVLSFLTNPWWVLPIEILEAMTGGIFRTAALMYCTDLVSLTSLASFRGLIGMAKGGIGKLLGSSIGTVIRENIGDRGTFVVMAIFAFTASTIYLIAYKILKKYQSKQLSRSQTQSKGKKVEKGVENPAWVDNESEMVSK